MVLAASAAKISAISGEKSTPKVELPPEKKAMIDAKKGQIKNTPTFEAAKNIRYVNPSNLFNFGSSNPNTKPVLETVSAIISSATPTPQAQNSNKLDALQVALLGNNNKSSGAREYSFGLSKSTESWGPADKKNGGNTYSVDKENNRELLAKRFGQNKDSIFIS